MGKPSYKYVFCITTPFIIELYIYIYIFRFLVFHEVLMIPIFYNVCNYFKNDNN